MLRAAGIEFDVMPANADETVHPGETAEAYVRRVAEAKMRGVQPRANGRPVLAADTVVVVDGAILGKPLDREDAKRMLRMLSGRAHEVLTAVCLAGGPDPEGGPDKVRPTVTEEVRPTVMEKVRPTGTKKVRPMVTKIETTTVEFAPLTDEDIDWYVSSGEPDDKAGAYAIQGLASRFITRISGSYSNVVGLPVSLVFQMFKAVEFRP